MSDKLKLQAKNRDLAKDKPNHLRSSGKVPAVVHDHGKDSHHIVVDEAELKKAYHSAGRHATVDLDIDGKKMTTLIKEVTYRPATSKVYHTVFQAVKANEKVSAEIPVKLSDDIPAERASLLVVTGIDYVEVEALPKDLVDVIIVDAGSLNEAGDKLTVADIKAPAGMVIKTDPEQMVASVETPKDQVAEADAAAAEQAEADGAGQATEETADANESTEAESSETAKTD